jgi:hypothetical protein
MDGHGHGTWMLGWTSDFPAARRAALTRHEHLLLLRSSYLLVTLLKKIERMTSSGVVLRKAILRLPQKTAHTPASLCRKQGGSYLGQLALRRALSAPGHAPGCPELRPASANQPLGWPVFTRAGSRESEDQVARREDLDDLRPLPQK